MQANPHKVEHGDTTYFVQTLRFSCDIFEACRSVCRPPLASRVAYLVGWSRWSLQISMRYVFHPRAQCRPPSPTAMPLAEGKAIKQGSSGCLARLLLFLAVWCPNLYSLLLLAYFPFVMFGFGGHRALSVSANVVRYLLTTTWSVKRNIDPALSATASGLFLESFCFLTVSGKLVVHTTRGDWDQQPS